MNIPIIIAAFDPTAQALATYQEIDRQIQSCFAEHPIFWAYSSKGANKSLREDKQAASGPLEVLKSLEKQGYRQAVIQSLHLLPGQEFHQFVLECRQATLSCHIGRPILYSPQDYQKLADCLTPTILSHPDKAILLVGHGTNHPIWTAYHALETIFRRRFGRRIFVGVVEKNPVSETVPAEIAAAGFKQVCMIPLLLVAGMHYTRDVIGAGENSWRSRLQSQGLKVESIAHGLGLQPGLAGIILEHIHEAMILAKQQSLG